jgi:hypothetical protein
MLITSFRVKKSYIKTDIQPVLNRYEAIVTSGGFLWHLVRETVAMKSSRAINTDDGI